MVIRTSSKRAPTDLPFQPPRKSSPLSGGDVAPPDKTSRWHLAHASPYTICPRLACSAVNTPAVTDVGACARSAEPKSPPVTMAAASAMKKRLLMSLPQSMPKYAESYLSEVY